MEQLKYRVEHLQDDTYQVIEKDPIDRVNNTSEYFANSYKDTGSVVYQGRLADCESYIRFKESGYL